MKGRGKYRLRTGAMTSIFGATRPSCSKHFYSLIFWSRSKVSTKITYSQSRDGKRIFRGGPGWWLYERSCSFGKLTGSRGKPRCKGKWHNSSAVNVSKGITASSFRGLEKTPRLETNAEWNLFWWLTCVSKRTKLKMTQNLFSDSFSMTEIKRNISWQSDWDCFLRGSSISREPDAKPSSSIKNLSKNWAKESFRWGDKCVIVSRWISCSTKSTGGSSRISTNTWARTRSRTSHICRKRF